MAEKLQQVPSWGELQICNHFSIMAAFSFLTVTLLLLVSSLGWTRRKWQQICVDSSSSLFKHQVAKEIKTSNLRALH